MKNILLVASLLALYGCGNNGGNSGRDSIKTETSVSENLQETDESTIRTSTSSVSISRKVNLLEDFSNIEEFKENINTYLVTFKATSGHFKGTTVECKKKNFDGTNKTFKSAFDESGEKAVVTLKLETDDPAEVSFHCSPKYAGKQLDSAEFKLLKSFVISEKSIFQTSVASSKMGTLLLEKKGHLITEGADLELDIKELISLDGTISTFEKGKTASDNRPGLWGGRLKIQAHKSVGKISIELRGMNGGMQTNLPERITAVPAPGANGVCPGVNRNDPACIGRPGVQGFPGKDGFNGLAGGDAGILEFVFPQDPKDHLMIEVKHFPGQGSEGTLGGEGGEGSAGGKGFYFPGRVRRDGPVCPKCSLEVTNSVQDIEDPYQFPSGAAGARGVKGKDGARGADGKILDSKIIVKKPESEFIINFDWKSFN